MSRFGRICLIKRNGAGRYIVKNAEELSSLSGRWKIIFRREEKYSFSAALLDQG